ncbi:MAG: choice-of-anchor D domain-containing protein, partial [Candidatus Cloacimonetes bacterium]|nr:choice-of-anchor D domain-containing protein [Candidatus Cloacimonadota bacterium]
MSAGIIDQDISAAKLRIEEIYADGVVDLDEQTDLKRSETLVKSNAGITEDALPFGANASRNRGSITIGAGGSTSGTYDTAITPFGTYYQDGQNQILFTSSELSAAGLPASEISGLGWNIATAATQTMNGFNIEIKHTSATSVTAWETGFTNVYSGTHVAAGGWNDFTFTSPFVWDGTSNILVKVCFNNSSYTSNSTAYYDNTSGSFNGFTYSDYTSGCSDPYGSNTLARPQTRFEYIYPGDTCDIAIPIGEVTNLPFNTSLATASGFGSYMYSKDLWYVYTPPANGTVYVGTCGSSFDTKLVLWGECDDTTDIAYNDDSCGLQSELFNNAVVAGEDYYIQVGGYSSYNGPGVLDVVFTIGPPVIAVNPTSMDEYLNIGETSTQILNVENFGDSDLNFSISRNFLTDGDSSAPRNYGDYADRSREVALDVQLPKRLSTSMRQDANDSRVVGEVIATYTGMPPAITGMVWAGDLLYVLNYDFGAIDVYDSSTQSVIASYPIHGYPYGITWDGMYLWIGDGAGNVYAYNLDGSSAGFSFSSPEAGNYPVITWDGNYFIIAQAWNPTNIYRVDETGSVIDVYANPSTPITEMCWAPDHATGNLWATTEYQDIRQINLNDGSGEAEVITQFPWPAGWDNWAYAIDHHNFNLWWSDWEGPLLEVDDGIMEGWFGHDIHNGALAPGENVDVTITFDATEIYGGTYLAELAVASNDPATPQVVVPIMLDVTGEPNIEVDVTNLDFGTVPYGESTPEYFTVSNTGNDWLDITETSCDNSDFTVVIPEAEDITIELEVDYYDYEATWNLWDYATSSYYYASNQTFSAAYQIVTTTITLEPGLYSVHCWDSYGDGGISGTVSDAQANVLVSWYMYDYSSYAEYDFGVDGLSDIALSLYVMEEQLLCVVFTPSTAGTITGDLTIYSNDPDEPELVIALSGECTTAEIVVDPTSMSEALFVDETGTQILTIENVGDEDLNFDITTNGIFVSDQVFDVTTFNDEIDNSSTKNISNGEINKPEFSKRIFSNQMQSRELANILVFEETPDNMHYDVALDNLGLSRTLVTDWYVLDSELIGGTVWDLVIVNSYNAQPSTTQLDNLNSYLVGGGNLIYCDWAMSSYSGHVLLQSMDISYVSSLSTPINFSAVDPGHSIFNSPNEINNLFWSDNQYSTDGQIVDVLGAATQLAAFDGYASSGACVLNANGTSFFNAFQADNFNGDDDSDGKLDIIELIENQISYFAEVTWLSVDISTGLLMPGESIEIIVTFDATDMYGGTYEAELVIENNDPDNLDLVVPVTLDVTGIPNIAVDPLIIDYGAHYVGATIEEILTIFSTGSDDLEITDITSDNPDFYCDITTYTISPDQDEEVIVYFNPSTVGVITGELTVYSNDPNDPEVYIDLTGEGLDAPEIVITPASFEVNIAPEVSMNDVLVIENTGVVNVDYNISIEYQIPTDRARNYGDYADRSREVSSEVNLLNRRPSTMRQGNSDNRSVGDVLGTYTGMPSANTGMVWVGDLLYIVNYDYNTLDVYDISTQSVIAAYLIHGNAYGMTWDGNYLWIGDGIGNVLAYNLDGSSAGFSFTCPETGNFPVIAWDGNYFIIALAWYTTNIYRVDETGSVIDVYANPSAPISEMCWAPEHTTGNLWATTETQEIMQLNLNDGTGEAEVITQFPWPAGWDSWAYAIDHHNFNLWWSDWEGPLYEIDDGIVEFSWLTIDITSGTLGTGEFDDITLTVDANEVDSLGVYEASLVVMSNDPDDPVVYVPVTLTVNHPPEIILPDDFTFDEDDGLMIDFDGYITDPDSSPYVLSVSGNTNVTVDIVGSEVTFGAAPDWNGTETLTFAVDDGQIDTDVVDIIVTPVNDDPTIVLPDDFTFEEDDELVVDFSIYIDDVDLNDLF